nr:hypothetical protein [Rhizobium laguerreae]
MIGDQRLRDLPTGVEEQREDAFRHAAVSYGALDGSANQLGCAGVAGVGFCDEGQPAASAEAVSLCDRKSQGKVRCAEGSHWTEPGMPKTDIGAGHRGLFWKRLVDADVEVSAIAEHRRKKPQLTDRSAARSPRAPAAGRFPPCSFRRVHRRWREYFPRSFQKTGALVWGRLSIGVERRFGQCARVFQIAELGAGETRLKSFTAASTPQSWPFLPRRFSSPPEAHR